MTAAKLYNAGAVTYPHTAGEGFNFSWGDDNNNSNEDMPVPCHNHTSSLLTTSQTRSLAPSAGEMMQLSSPTAIFFPTRKLDVVFPTGL